MYFRSKKVTLETILFRNRDFKDLALKIEIRDQVSKMRPATSPVYVNNGPTTPALRGRLCFMLI